jgi:hypothetical protein
MEAKLPRVPDVIQEPLYRAEATGLELSDDYVQFESYMEWFFRMAYVTPETVTC